MKKIIWYVLLLAAALALPRRKADVGKLRPVEVVQLSREGSQYVICTDTGDRGSGASVELAFQDLKQTTPGTVYLDTAAYLILRGGTEETAQTLGTVLKKKVRVCRTEEQLDLAAAADYLSVHEPEVTLDEMEPGTELQELAAEGTRLILR